MADLEKREREEREDELRHVPLQQSDRATWPRGVRSVGLGEVDELGVDATGRLYWQGKPVEIIGQRLVLSFWQKAWAVVLGSGALATFVVTLANGVTDLVDWGCDTGLLAAGWCPTP